MLPMKSMPGRGCFLVGRTLWVFVRKLAVDSLWVLLELRDCLCFVLFFNGKEVLNGFYEERNRENVDERN